MFADLPHKNSVDLRETEFHRWISFYYFSKLVGLVKNCYCTVVESDVNCCYKNYWETRGRSCCDED